jgi:hypothetical protein
MREIVHIASPEIEANKRPRYSTTPEDRESDTEASNELSVEDFLEQFPGYPRNMANTLMKCPFRTGPMLMKLKAGGFTMTEEDPLVHAIIDVGDANAVAFYNGGNYALQAGVPGALAWPGAGGIPPLVGAALHPGVAAAPPAALGRFISSLPGVVNKSGAALTLFYFPNNESVHSASIAIRDQPQFRRCSPATAAAFGVPASPSPVSFVQLERMDGVPQVLRGFGEV